MKRPTRHGGLDDLLRCGREEKGHSDFVDGKRNRLCEREVAFRCVVRPDDGNRRAEGEQEEPIEEATVPAMAEPRRPAPLCVETYRVPEMLRPCLVPHRVPVVLVTGRRMTPESTARPVRDTALKNRSSPATSRSMND